MTPDPSEVFRAAPKDTGRPAYIRRTWAEYEADIDSRHLRLVDSLSAMGQHDLAAGVLVTSQRLCHACVERDARPHDRWCSEACRRADEGLSEDEMFAAEDRYSWDVDESGGFS